MENNPISRPASNLNRISSLSKSPRLKSKESNEPINSRNPSRLKTQKEDVTQSSIETIVKKHSTTVRDSNKHLQSFYTNKSKLNAKKMAPSEEDHSPVSKV